MTFGDHFQHSQPHLRAWVQTGGPVVWFEDLGNRVSPYVPDRPWTWLWPVSSEVIAMYDKTQNGVRLEQAYMLHLSEACPLDTMVLPGMLACLSLGIKNGVWP